MATKPTLWPEIWGTAGNYVASNYPNEYPWGDPRPDAGNPTPWGGNPRRDATGLAAYCAQGLTPLLPDLTPLRNEQEHRISAAIKNWLRLGSSTGAADAHIVETDASGFAGVYSLTVPTVFTANKDTGTVTSLVQFVMSEDSSLAAGKQLEGTSTSSVRMGSFEGIPGASSTVNGAIFVDAEGCLRYRLITDQFVHWDGIGFYNGSGELEATSGPLAIINATTSTKTAAKEAAGRVKVECTGRVRRAAVGAGLLQLQESELGVIWNNIGTAQATHMLDNSTGGLWTSFRIRTSYAPGDTTGRFFRCVIDGDGGGCGSNGTHEEVMIVAKSHW